MQRYPRLLALFLVFSSAGAFATDQSSKDQSSKIVGLLERMSTAFSTLNYDGVFVYSHGNSMDTLRIIHRVKDGVERERIVRLNGPSHEIIRNGQEVTCVHSSNWQGDINHSIPAGPFARAFVRDMSALHSYRLSMLQSERILGRDAVGVAIIPVDDFRYGYRVWLDDETGLLLKSKLLYRGRVLERFQFTQLSLDQPIPDAALEMGIKDEVMAHYPMLAKTKATIEPSTAPWKLSWAPEGFRVSVQGIRANDRDGSAADTLTYSDGMATFSVFVEKARGKTRQQVVSQVGATVAVARIMRANSSEHIVTVVGEVPLTTAEKLAASVVPVKSDD